MKNYLQNYLLGISLLYITAFIIFSTLKIQAGYRQYDLKPYSIRSSQKPYKVYKLLIASSIGRIDMATYVHSMRSYLGTGVKFLLNCHDGDRSREHLEVYIHDHGVGDLVLSISALPGAKILFWKKYLTPDLAASFDIIWLMDSDMLFNLNYFPLRRFLNIAMLTGASIFQPTVIGPDIHEQLKFKPTSDRYVAQAVCFVEVMTPFILSDMWQQIHKEGLLRVHDTILRTSSWGIDDWWCDFAASQQLRTVTLLGTNHTLVPACLLVQAISIVHLDTRSMPRGSRKRREPRLVGIEPWKKVSNQTNVTNHCSSLNELLVKQQQILFYADDNKLNHATLELVNPNQNNESNSNKVFDDWKENTAKIYIRNRQQDVKKIQELNANWKDKVLIGNISSWELLQLLKNVTDPTDNTLIGMSQWNHALQVYTAMKADNVTSSKALFLALVHDLGKLLVLFGEDVANVMCSTIVLKSGEPKKGLDQTVTTWNHDEFGFLKLHKYIPRDVAWVIRYHSNSALLKGELDEFLTPEEFICFPLVRLIWKYDHFSKSTVYKPNVDLDEARAVVETFLPRTIIF